jgi:hypothetical protein
MLGCIAVSACRVFPQVFLVILGTSLTDNAQALAVQEKGKGDEVQMPHHTNVPIATDLASVSSTREIEAKGAKPRPRFGTHLPP